MGDHLSDSLRPLWDGISTSNHSDISNIEGDKQHDGHGILFQIQQTRIIIFQNTETGPIIVFYCDTETNDYDEIQKILMELLARTNYFIVNTTSCSFEIKPNTQKTYKK